MSVCIVGAGVSGLTAIKACLEEGLDVVCYEKTAQIGGLWNYRPDQVEIATVMASTVINTSKEMMAYSDFPPPPEFPNFMHHSYVQRYLQLYADHFDLLKYIQFNTEVVKLEKDEDKWKANLLNGKIEQFDAAMICTGHHCDPLMPKLPGLQNFKGTVLHAKKYRDYHGFEGKRVFLLGIGNSALDIGVELAKIAKNVVISTRRGTWVFNRVIQNGLPYDVVYQSRFYQWLMRILPWSIANDFHEYRIQRRMDHDLYGLKPSHRFFQQHPAVNDALANLLSSGQISITDDICSIGPHLISTKDGRCFETDVLILCTGYTFGFPFLHPPNLITVTDQNEVELYKYVFPPTLANSKNNLAVIGLVQPIGSVAPISELQARWAAAVFAGRVGLPSAAEMRADIAEKRRAMRRQYFESSKHTLQVQFIPYMDELAELVGCKPELHKIFYHSPKFAFRLFFGPNLPYVYRISGPGAWEGAKLAIETLPDRVKMPLKQRNSAALAPRKYKGTVDRWFRYSATKCLALYLCILITLGLWLFARNDSTSNCYIFIAYNLLVGFVAFLVFLFHCDVTFWL